MYAPSSRKHVPMPSALRPQFNWTQYKLLISVSDPDKREYYELESLNNCWTARELERQKNSPTRTRPSASSSARGMPYNGYRPGWVVGCKNGL